MSRVVWIRRSWTWYFPSRTSCRWRWCLWTRRRSRCNRRKSTKQESWSGNETTGDSRQTGQAAQVLRPKFKHISLSPPLRAVKVLPGAAAQKSLSNSILVISSQKVCMKIVSKIFPKIFSDNFFGKFTKIWWDWSEPVQKSIAAPVSDKLGPCVS